jgi:hypothetical protein
LLASATGRAEAPASYEQEWMLYLSRMRRTGTFNMPRLYEVAADRSVDEVAAAIGSVVAGNGTLRTRFERRDGGFVQIVEDAGAGPEILPIEARDGDAAWAEATARIGEFVRRPLDPYDGGLFRYALAPVPGRGMILATVVHHTIADAVTLDEIERRILRALDGSRPTVETVGYADYAAWQRATHDSTLPDQIEAAATRLKGCEPTFLPGVAERSAVPGAGRSGSFDLTGVNTEALRALLTEERASPFMAGLTALAAALQAMGGRDRALIAIEVSTRTMAPLLTTLGPFISTVPVEIRGTGSFRARLRSTRDSVLEAMARGRIPYNRLLRRPEMREMRRGSERAVDVVYQTFHEGAVPAAGGILRPMPYGMDGAGFTADLHVSLHESPDGRRLGVGYSPRVPAEVVDELARRFADVLMNGVLDPDAPPNQRLEADRDDSGERGGG